MKYSIWPLHTHLYSLLDLTVPMELKDRKAKKKFEEKFQLLFGTLTE
jgi:hypothetical protein